MVSKLDEDIIMKDNTYNFFSSFSNYIRPRKRTYIDMLYDNNISLLTHRRENYELYNKSKENNSLFNSNNNENKGEDLIIKNINDINCIQNAKKNLTTKKNFEYDEEKERIMVANYYRIKNAELNRLRFGSN